MILFLKRVIGNVLTSRIVYNTLVNKSIENGFLKTSSGYLCVDKQAPFLQSLFYWGIYERSEVRLIRNYLFKNIPVIELGASLGMTTATICSIASREIPVISVEANPRLLANLEKTKKKNRFTNLSLISAAVDYSGQTSVGFYLDDRNLGSHKTDSDKAYLVPTIKLSDIVRQNQLQQYALVCDIEGAEVEMFFKENDPSTVEGCKQIIIELHDSKYKGKRYIPSDLQSVICKNFHMRVVYNDGKTWVFEKRNYETE